MAHSSDGTNATIGGTAAETRARLIAEAITLFEEAGLAGFTGREVAKRAGVSHGAPRRYFPSNAALLATVAANGFARLNERVDAVASVERPAADALEAVATAYIDFAREQPNLFDLMFRHDLLAHSGESLRENSLPLLGRLHTFAHEAYPNAHPAAAVDLWLNLHGIAVLHSRNSLELLGIDAAAAVKRAISAQLAEVPTDA